MLTTRAMIFLSAAAAAGIVFVTEPSHSEQTFGVEHAKLQDRHPTFKVADELRGALAAERDGTAIPAPKSTPKSDQLDVVGNCDGYTWPRIPAACLKLAGDDATRSGLRQVLIEDRPADRISIVTPAATIVAQR